MAIVRGAPDHNGLEAWTLLHEWYQPKTRSRGLALLNEILGWDFRIKEQFLQRMKDRENATVEYNRTANAPLREEVLVAVLISRSPKEVRTYLHVQVREETARLSHVRQLLYDYLRAGKAWKAPRTVEVAEANAPNLVPMDVDSLHRKGGKEKKGKDKGKNKGDRNRHDGNSDTLTGIATSVASTDTRNHTVQARATSSMARITIVEHMDTRELTVLLKRWHIWNPNL